MKQFRQFFLSNRLKIFLTIGIDLLILSFIFTSYLYALEITLTQETICKGTDYQTIAYHFSSEQEGPTIMIMAGVHGNELAGIEASRKFIVDFMPERGSVIIIPEANKKACINKVRAIPLEEGDLNRSFPGDVSSNGINRLAGEIFKIIREKKVFFLLDLHESVDYYYEDSAHYGQTIILDDKFHPILQEISNYLIKRLNSIVTESKNYFEIIVKPIHGCSTYEALKTYGIPGITFETCTKIKFSERVAFHYYCIQSLLEYYNVISSSLLK